MKTCAKWITYLQMDWQGHTLESPHQFRLISLKIMGCCYLILETETCPWNMRTFTDIYKVTKPGGNKKTPVYTPNIFGAKYKEIRFYF